MFERNISVQLLGIFTSHRYVPFQDCITKLSTVHEMCLSGQPAGLRYIDTTFCCVSSIHVYMVFILTLL